MATPIADSFAALLAKMEENDRKFQETVDAMLDDVHQAIEQLDRINQETGDWL